MQAVLPWAGATVPAEQFMQAVCEAAAAYFPGGQTKQAPAVSLTAAKEPGGHGAHEDVFVALKFPAGHRFWTMVLTGDITVPGEHMAQVYWFMGTAPIAHDGQV